MLLDPVLGLCEVQSFERWRGLGKVLGKQTNFIRLLFGHAGCALAHLLQSATVLGVTF